jgi:hypothetical protein
MNHCIKLAHVKQFVETGYETFDTQNYFSYIWSAQ